MGRNLWPLAPQFMPGRDGEIDELAEMDQEMLRAHRGSALIITPEQNPLFSQEVSSFESFPAATFPSEEKKRCLFQFQPPLFVSLMTRCGNWDRKQTVGLGFYFLFKCSHCLRQNCDFPPLATPHKAHLPWCPPQMAIQGISFLKALSRVLFLWESII